MDVVTRWNRSLDMIERYLEQQQAVAAALLSVEVRRNAREIDTLDAAEEAAPDSPKHVAGQLESEIDLPQREHAAVGVSRLHPKIRLLKIYLGFLLFRWTAEDSQWMRSRQTLTRTAKRPLSHSLLLLSSGGEATHIVTHCCQPWPSHISLSQQPQS